MKFYSMEFEKVTSNIWRNKILNKGYDDAADKLGNLTDKNNILNIPRYIVNGFMKYFIKTLSNSSMPKVK